MRCAHDWRLVRTFGETAQYGCRKCNLQAYEDADHLEDDDE